MSAAAEENHSFTSDNSFVILGQGSLTSDVNLLGDQCSNTTNMQNMDQSAMDDEPMASNQISWGSDPSSIDVQVKLDQLVKENLLLKETLNQSNMAMKNQFDTLLLWQQEVMKTHESHKQKFLETQDQISKLRSENMNLKKQVEHNSDGSSDCKKNKNDMLFLDRSLEPVTDNLKMLLDLTERKCKQLTVNNVELILRIRDLERVLRDTRREKQALEREFDDHLNLCNDISDNERLNEDDPHIVLINEGGKKDDVNCKISVDNHNLMDDDDDEDVNALNAFPANMNKGQANAHMSNPRVKVERREGNSDRIFIRRMDYEKLIKEYEDLKVEHRFCKRSITEQLEVTRGLSLDLQEMKEQLKFKNREFQEVKNEIQRMMLECEEVAILRAQVELYQNDFNEERKAREQAVGEKEEMAKQVRLLEKQLHELKLNMQNNENKIQDNETTNLKPDGTTERTDNLQCFKCGKTFQQFRELQDHVEECLELRK